MRISVPAARVLTWDLENRPSTYWYQDRTTAEITAIAWSWGKAVTCMALGQYPLELILSSFLAAYTEADMVTGHYIRKHDLPIVNFHMLEKGYPPLEPKLTQDTRLDLKKGKDLSVSQENLAAMLGCKAPKVQMNQVKWREANRLLPEGIVSTMKRCVGDVQQHMEMRKRLLQLGWLKPPKVWRP